MAGMLDLETLKALVKSGEIDTVVVAIPDMLGRLMGKRFQANYFIDEAHEETHFCNYLLANDAEMEPVPGYEAASWAQGYGDFIVRPDLATLRRIPWLEATALVLGDVVDHHGDDLAHSPRAILKAQLARIAEKKMTAFFASELEFYLFDNPYGEARERRYRDLRPSGWYIEDYHILQTSFEEPFMRALRNGLEAAGVPVENSKGEYAPGQGEINVRYAEALEMADRHVILKNAAKEIAHLQGRALTFMAKPFDDLSGNSSHIHNSLWSKNGRRALFHDAKDEHGMSGLMKSWVAGQLALARDMTLLLAPNVNSYKRFQAGSFAPTKAAWSVDNRTAGFRLCGHGRSIRIEARIGGADLNPYLAYAALIAAGLHGVENELELSPPLTGDVYANRRAKEVPATLREAVTALDRSKPLRAALGDAVVDHYVHAGRWEQAEHDRKVTDWELIRGFERA